MTLRNLTVEAIMNPPRLIPVVVLLLAACGKSNQYLTPQDLKNNTLSNASVELNASTPALSVQRGAVFTDNNAAFAHKLALVNRAQHSIDMAYYIYANDYSSAVLSQALLAASQRGVKVRLLVDYHSNYNRLDFFLMLQQHSHGQIQVRFYNRPDGQLIKDAVYLTLPCPENTARADCGAAKFKHITDKLTGKDLANYNSGGSGLFLSGLYSKKPDVLGAAIIEGQKLDLSQFFPKDNGQSGQNSQDLTALFDFAKVYWASRHTTGFDRWAAQLKLELALALYHEKLNPIMTAVRAVLPIGERPDEQAAWQAWQHFTDYLHHKFLLVDGQHVQLGGRNIEDPYHMNFNPLVEKYVFMDTDVALDLNQTSAALQHSFEALWDFKTMTADLDEVLAHAPNDFVVAHDNAQQQCLPQSDCYQKTFLQQNRQQRQQQQHMLMQQHAATYWAQAMPKTTESDYVIDKTAKIYYLENLPFQRQAQDKQRLFGAVHNQEGASGKAIHQVWLAALRNTCQQASAEHPQHIWLHNAYFFLPFMMLSQLAEMVDGSQDCRHVHVKVLTNSLATTDLGIINLLSRYSMKAFADYYQHHRHPEKSASFAYYEYLPRYQNRDGENLNRHSLHSKVMVLGDDIFIGSANADVRSLMMDSNNGLFIRDAPQFIHAYAADLYRKISDPQQVKEVTAHFFGLDLAKMLNEDKTQIFDLFRTLFDIPQPSEARQKEEAWSQAVLTRVLPLLQQVYELSSQGLQQHWHNETYQARFNAYFKFF